MTGADFLPTPRPAPATRRLRGPSRRPGSLPPANVQFIRGFGLLRADSLRDDMSELGSVNRCQAATQLGVAPFDSDGGRTEPPAGSTAVAFISAAYYTWPPSSPSTAYPGCKPSLNAC